MSLWYLAISIGGNYIITKLKRIDIPGLKKKFDDRHVETKLQKSLSDLAWKFPPVIIPILDILFRYGIVGSVMFLAYNNFGFEKMILLAATILIVSVRKNSFL